MKSKALFGIVPRLIKKIYWSFCYWDMDCGWHLFGSSSWEFFPPSYYYRFSAEELEKKRAAIAKRVYELLKEIDNDEAGI